MSDAGDRGQSFLPTERMTGVNCQLLTSVNEATAHPQLPVAYGRNIAQLRLDHQTLSHEALGL